MGCCAVCSGCISSRLIGLLHICQCYSVITEPMAPAAQFGKVDTNIYIMDYNPAVISAAQAFSISLSTFDSKVWF